MTVNEKKNMGGLSGSIYVSDGFTFDVYFFSDCLNENFFFLQNDSNPFKIIHVILSWTQIGRLGL